MINSPLLYFIGPSMPNHEKFPIDSALVKQLVSSQFPQWADLLIKPIKNNGWDNSTFHLGDEMTIRLPSAECYAEQVNKEQHWLPKLAPYLPLPIPQPLAIGKPGHGYPWNWSIYKWLEGETATHNNVGDHCQFATDLGHFLSALQQCDTTNAPESGEHNFFRGGLLSTYDSQTREALKKYSKNHDVTHMTKIWEKALSSSWQQAPLWVHGDVATTNLLVQNGKLSAVIDFGCMSIGDPACDLAIAWTFFKDESRGAFKAALALDDDTWARGRGWVLWKTLCAPLPGTEEQSRRIIEELVMEHMKK